MKPGRRLLLRASGDARSKKTQQNRGIAQARITMEIFEHCICLQCGDCLEMSDRSIEEVNERCNLEEEEVFGHGRRGDPGPLALARGSVFISLTRRPRSIPSWLRRFVSLTAKLLSTSA